MSIYAEELVAESESVLEHVKLLLTKFDRGIAAPDLLLDVGILENRLLNVDRLMPEGMTIDWGRKLHFMKYYLKQGTPEACRGDVVELSDYILPAAITKIKELGRASVYLDAELRVAVSSLIRMQQFSSAIRAAFVLLTERMRKRFGLPDGVDGAAMVNTVFGSGSTHLLGLMPAERQARRDYLAGLYGVLRNKYAHSDPPLDPVELEAVLSGVNLALKLIE